MPFVLPAGLALPPYAVPDDAYTQTFSAASLGDAGGVIYRAQGKTIDVVVIVSAVLVTDATVGTRVTSLTVATPEVTQLFAAPVPTAAAPTQQHNITWSMYFTAAYSTFNGSATYTQVVPIPTVALPPTSTISISKNVAGGSDTITSIAITLVRIPTGVTMLAAVPDLVPSPIAL